MQCYEKLEQPQDFRGKDMKSQHHGNEVEVLQALDRVLCYPPGGVMAVEEVKGRGLQGPFVSPLTCGVCELESDGFVRDAADIADRHLACVAGIILRSKVLQLQDFGFTLGFGKNRGKKRHRSVQSTGHHSKPISCPKIHRLPAAPVKTLGNCADFNPHPALYKGGTKCLQWSFHLQGFTKQPVTV